MLPTVKLDDTLVQIRFQLPQSKPTASGKLRVDQIERRLYLGVDAVEKLLRDLKEVLPIARMNVKKATQLESQE